MASKTKCNVCIQVKCNNVASECVLISVLWMKSILISFPWAPEVVYALKFFSTFFCFLWRILWPFVLSPHIFLLHYIHFSSCLPPPSPHPYPQSHLISLQSVWLIYHCSEILKSLLPPVLGGGPRQHTHTCKHIHTDTHVFWRWQTIWSNALCTNYLSALIP